MDSIQSIQDWAPQHDSKYPLVIAGPCSAESETQVLKTAQALSKLPQVRYFRAGIWKPRTRPNTFEGVGEAGLPWLKLARRETGLPIATEVANAAHVELALKHEVDLVWIGARTTVSPFAIQEIAEALKGTDIPVLVKNPMNADLSLWLGAIERFTNVGLRKLGAIHRGFSSYQPSPYRNLPLWQLPMELKRRFPGIPLICDPSHIAGQRDMIYAVSQKAMDLDLDGLMIETHPTPAEALSDAEQQVTPEMLSDILARLAVRNVSVENPEFQSELDELRVLIDRIDQDILEALAHRMQVVSKIGAAKIRSGVTALQVSRMDAILKKQTAKALEMQLNPDHIHEIYRSIHEESVRLQTEMMRDVGKEPTV
jgi:chorismate mutase